MAFVNIPPNLQDMFYQITDRIAKLETGPNQAMYYAEAAQGSSVQASNEAAQALSQAQTANALGVQAIAQATIAIAQGTQAIQAAQAAQVQATQAYNLGAQSIQKNASTITNASNQLTAINGNGITVYSGASSTSGARVVLNSAGLAGYNAGGTATFSILASTGAVSTNGAIFTSSTITGGSLNINGQCTINSAGELYANGATIIGNITATSGTFTGTVYASAGTFTGTITSSNATITGGSLTVGSTFSVNSSGFLIASSGTIGGTSITSTALTGGTIQTSSGSTAIIMNGSSNALQFKVSGSVSGNIVPLGVAGILMHYGSSPDSSGSTYPKVQMTFSTALLAASASIYVQSTTSGNSASGDFRCFNAFQVDGNSTFNGLMYAPNLSTTTDAANMRVATGTIGQIYESSASSIRFKQNVVNVSSVFDIDPRKLLDLPVRAFAYKDDYLSEDDDRYGIMLPGFIAEEVDAIYPVAADYGQDGPHSWNERFIIPGMLSLIQDLDARVKQLEQA